MARKTFVLDTNVLLHDPQSIFKFQDNLLIIPVTVLEELDKMKRVPGDLGKNARDIIRILDSLKDKGTGNLHTGVILNGGLEVRIIPEIKPQPSLPLPLDTNDNRIILTALSLKEKGENVIYVSKDIASRVKAASLGLEAEDYENLKVDSSTLTSGIQKISVEKREIDLFYKDGHVTLTNGHSFNANEYCVFTSPENSSAIGRYNAQLKQFDSLLKTPPLWGIKPKNVEQKCAIDLLMRDDIQLVALIGQAGTGKTLLALAAGLRKVFDESAYSRILVSRPIVPLGRDIGYLPGTKEEKLYHWMQPIYDNLEFLCDSSGNVPSETLKWVMESKKLEMEAVTYIRGRSLPKMFIIVDEAQNLTPHEVKTIISRAGEGTKVILAGDPTQIDNPYLDKDSNGLSYTISRFQNQKIFGHMFLDKTERSELAAIAADLL